MKKIVVALSILYVLASCSNDVVKDVSGKKEICFEATVQTKGTMTTTDDLEKFYATAYSLSIESPNSTDLTDLDLFFENVEFERNGNAFYSFPAYYWPDVRAMIFVLWSPSLDEVGMECTMSSEEKTSGSSGLCFFKNVTPKSDISEQVDILCTLAVGASEKLGYDEYNGAYDGMINFSQEKSSVIFRHLLSAIQLKAKGSSKYNYFIKGIRIANVYGTANRYLDGWFNLSNLSTYETCYENPIEFSSESVNVMPSDTDFAFLLPQELNYWNPEDPDSKGAYIAVLLQATDLNGNVVYPSSGGEDDYQWSAIPISGEWEESTTYTYTLDFSEGGFGYEASNTNPTM